MGIILIYILAVYTATLLLTEADGPFGLLYKLRRIQWLGALHCFLCTSLYLAALAAIVPARNLGEWLLYTLAICGGATSLHKVTWQ